MKQTIYFFESQVCIDGKEKRTINKTTLYRFMNIIIIVLLFHLFRIGSRELKHLRK